MFMGFVNNGSTFTAIYPVTGDYGEPVVASSTYVVYGPLGETMPNSSGSSTLIVQGVYKASIPVSSVNLYEAGKFYYIVVTYTVNGHSKISNFTFGVV
jgi:hypothetical protein